MSSVLVELLYWHATMILSTASFHSGSCSHRLKQLEKWNRRVLFQLGLLQSMDTSTHESVFEYMSFPHDLKRPYVSDDQVSCIKQNTIKERQVTELGIALSRILHVQNVPLTISSCDEPSGKEGQFCEEVKIDEPKCLNATTQKVMNKCLTFPSSKKQLSCPSPVDGRNGVPGTELHGDNYMKTGNPVCSRSLSLPTPSNLVSAMKGGREKQGITPLKNVTVKWARDVYDPPTTSVSHSVQNQQRPSSGPKSNKKKQQGRNKNNKGKSSRGSNGDKQQHRKYNCNSDLRPKSPVVTSDKLLLLGCFNQSPVELVDFGVVTEQDSKCGNSFFRTSALSKVHISVAEAA